MTGPPPATPPAAGEFAAVELAGGKQLLLYEPSGPLGGRFLCSRCRAPGLQPDLLAHRPDCPYADTTGSRGSR